MNKEKRVSFTHQLQQNPQVLMLMDLLGNLEEVPGNITEMAPGSPWGRNTSSLKVDYF